ncbi:conserved hypothetical protein [Capnocytophaga canimorsus]|nr:hypothetical protein [Capnocytophaga canimorsus]CEN50859.1 conserved hypothetical protein [Capnocytophaga canimorsus]
MLSRWIHFFILPCQQISYLEEKRISGGLNFKEKIQHYLHLKVCKWCKAYHKKVAFIDRRLSESTETPKNNHFDEFEIQQFKDKLSKKMDK